MQPYCYISYTMSLRTFRSNQSRVNSLPASARPPAPSALLKFIDVKDRALCRAAVAGLFSMLSFGALSAPSAGARNGEMITPNYKDTELGQVIQAVSEITGKNFIIDPRVNAKITMLSASPMSSAAFYEAFLAVLQVYGYVAMPAGDVIKIIPNTDARQMPSIDLRQSIRSTSDEIVTQIITMKNLSAAQLVPLLRPLIPQQGHLAAYAQGNLLIISDRANNVSRVVKIIERMEESGDDPIEVIPLHNASSADVVRTINQINQGPSAVSDAGGAPIGIIADVRTNSVLIGGEKSVRLRTKALVFDLDTPREGGSGDTEVRYLLYADAEKLADKLKGQASAFDKMQGGPQSGGSTAAANAGSSAGANVTIWADIPTNALIITAPPRIMKSLMAVIEKLDIRRAQVEVEAMIVEVDANRSANIGVQWILDGGSSLGYGVTNLPGSGSSIINLAEAVEGVSSSTAGTTAAALSSAIPAGVTYPIGYYDSSTKKGLAGVIQALRSDGTSNILSMPRVITMNNEEAEVKVTQEIPLITGQYSSSTASTNGTTSPFETIQREEVGTIFKVTPHISDGAVISLNIEQEDSSPGAKLTDSSDISTNKRSIKTTVLIEDGGTIVLGGLMQDTVTESQDRVPGLSAIPFIGNLFKSRTSSRQKRNLLVFIRPTILRDQAVTEVTSQARYNEVRDEQKNLHKGKVTLLPGETQPSIPPIPTDSTPSPAPLRVPTGGSTNIGPASQRGSSGSITSPAPTPALPASQPTP